MFEKRPNGLRRNIRNGVETWRTCFATGLRAQNLTTPKQRLLRRCWRGWRHPRKFRTYSVIWPASSLKKAPEQWVNVLARAIGSSDAEVKKQGIATARSINSGKDAKALDGALTQVAVAGEN